MSVTTGMVDGAKTRPAVDATATGLWKAHDEAERLCADVEALAATLPVGFLPAAMRARNALTDLQVGLAIRADLDGSRPHTPHT